MRYVRLLLVSLILAGLSLPVIPERAVRAYPVLTPNAGEAVVAPYDSITTGVGWLNAGSNATSSYTREVISQGQDYRIRQSGNITRVRYWTANATNLVSFKVTIWRLVGTNTYTKIGTSEELSSHMTTGQITDVELATPIMGVQEGDFFGFILQTSIAGQPVFDYHYTGDNLLALDSQVSSNTSFTWTMGGGISSIASRVPIQLYMTPPQVVFIGDSIISGSPYHVAFLKNTSTTNISSTIEYQLGSLTGYTYQNMGYPSQTTTNISARFTQDALNSGAPMVVIEGGINDIGVDSKATFVANWKSMLDAAQASTNITRIIVLKILPCSSANASAMQTRDDWNNTLAAMISANYSKARLIDTSVYVGQYRQGGDSGNYWDIQSAYYTDGIHYNQAGATKIAQAILDQMDDWSATWSYRKQIFFNNTASSENLTYWTTDINLTSVNFNFAHAQPDGDDIRIVDSDGILLPYYTEGSSAFASNNVTIWFNKPLIAASSNTSYVWLYYGNTEAANAESRVNTFPSSRYAMFAPFWSSLTTANNSATLDNNTTPLTQVNQSGTLTKTGQGWVMSGQQYFTHSIANYNSASSSGAIKAWVKKTADSNTIVDSSDIGSNQSFIELYTSSGKPSLTTRNNAGATNAVTGTTNITGTWAQVIISSNGTVWQLFLNGAVNALTPIAGSNNGDWFADITLRDNINIGAEVRLAAPGGFLQGTIGAVEILTFPVSLNQSAQMFLTEKWRFLGTQNQEFVSFGSEEPHTSPSVTTLPASSINMNKDGTNNVTLSGNLTDLGGALSSINGWFAYWITGQANQTTTNVSYNTTGVKSVIISSLTPGATYNINFNATNAAGTTAGNTESFTLTMPSVVTGGITTPLQATMHIPGNLTSLGVASDTYLGVEYGTTPALGTLSALQTSNATGAFTVTLNNVDTTHTFYYRVFAKVGSTYSYGSTLSVSQGNPQGFGILRTIIPFVIAGGVLVFTLGVMIANGVQLATLGSFIAGIMLSLLAYLVARLMMG